MNDDGQEMEQNNEMFLCCLQPVVSSLLKNAAIWIVQAQHLMLAIQTWMAGTTPRKTNIKNLKNAAEFGTGKHRGFQPLVILKNGDIFFRSANLRATCHMPLRIWEVKCHVSPEIESLKKDRWHWIPPIQFNPLRWWTCIAKPLHLPEA